MAESLPPRRRDVLALEQRIPEGYSATEAEHRWHPCPSVQAQDVTGQSATEVLQLVNAFREAAPTRVDTVYRAVLTVTETTSWVLG